MYNIFILLIIEKCLTYFFVFFRKKNHNRNKTEIKRCNVSKEKSKLKPIKYSFYLIIFTRLNKLHCSCTHINFIFNLSNFQL